jgi:hypothetical protein
VISIQSNVRSSMKISLGRPGAAVCTGNLYLAWATSRLRGPRQLSGLLARLLVIDAELARLATNPNESDLNAGPPLGHCPSMIPLTPAAVVAACALLLASCAIRPPPLTPDNVGQFDLCLCATAEPPRDNRGQCLAELARRQLTCDAAEWSAYWARRGR